jgi:von Willebrand factor type A domain/Aerotolerance regulator N-terminal
VILAGLPFATLALVFGAAAAIVTALYILKLRRRAVSTPFAPLWHRILRDKEATSLFSKLKRVLSLLVQLLLLLLLVAALGDPRVAGSLVEGRNLVVLVDASASMQATDVSPTRLGVAREHVKSMIRGLGGADRMLIAQMDAVVTPMGPMSGDSSELERALEKISPTDTRADFPRALRFATDTLRGVKKAEIVVVSDGNLGEATDAGGAVHLGDVKLSYVEVGKGSRNVGVTAFSVRRYPLDKSRYEVMLEVTNTGDSPEDVELTLSGDGQPVDITKLRLKPGERLPRFYPNLSGASRTLEAKLGLLDGTKDDLPADDRAYALLPERRRAKVLVVTTGNTYLEAALLLDEYLDVTQLTPVAYAARFPGGATGFDAVLFDAATPLEPPRANAIYLDPRGPGSPVKVLGELSQPGFDHVDRKHPIVRFLALDNVNIAKGHKLQPEPGDRVVGASQDGPLLVAGDRGGFKFVALGFDVRESDLPLRVAWPIFLVDMINWFTDEDATYLSSFRTGEVWRIPLGVPASVATLKRPDGRTVDVPVHEGRAVYLGDEAGFYELSAKAAPGAPAGRTAFAANLLDATESRIAPQPSITVDGKVAGPLEGFHVGVRREVWIYLLILAIVLTAIEWATYHRRITV